MKLLYGALTTIFYPLIIIIIFFRRILNKEDSIRYKEKLFPSKFDIKRSKNLKLIWFHAASLGELKSIIPIIEEFNKTRNDLEFLITSVTLSSGKLAKEELKKFNNVQHRFFPVDVPFVIKQFILLWKPSAIFLVDSEIWPNLIFIANDKKVPIAILNARITRKTFNKWKIISKTAKSIFGLFGLCLSSNLETEKFLKEFNAKNTHFIGNLKLCEKVKDIANHQKNNNYLTTKKFWVAVSTHEGEEHFCLNTHIELKKNLNDIKTIIAPRHIERSDKIREVLKKNNLQYQILNKDELIDESKEIIIINSYGSLSSFLKNTRSVFMGKSTLKRLENVGGQNPLEAAKFGCKIYHGPYVYNFKEIYEILMKNNVSQKINDVGELSQFLLSDFKSSDLQSKDFKNTIDKLGEEVLASSMSKINNFLLNENI